MAVRLSVFVSILVCAALFIGNSEAARAGAWSPAMPMPSERYLHTATLLHDGDVLIAGGTAFVYGPPYVVSSSALRYHPDTDSWSSAGALGTARDRPTATLLRDGRVLLLGGTDEQSYLPLASGELYDPTTNNWSRSAPMHQARGGHTATLLNDGRVVVLGGCAGVCDGVTNSDWAGAEIYDPATDAWTAPRDAPVKREGHTATLLLDGRVLVVGGRASIWPAPAQVYDPATDTWTGTPEPMLNRVSHTATRLDDGRVLIVGGDLAPCGGFLCGVLLGGLPAEIYGPRENTWVLVDGPASRAHVATLLKSGRVLVTGGVDLYGNAVPSAESYDPGTNSWTTEDNMATPRDRHTATLLKNGRVLAAGGYGDPLYGFVSAAEVYKPAQSRRR